MNIECAQYKELYARHAGKELFDRAFGIFPVENITDKSTEIMFCDDSLRYQSSLYFINDKTSTKLPVNFDLLPNEFTFPAFGIDHWDVRHGEEELVRLKTGINKRWVVSPTNQVFETFNYRFISENGLAMYYQGIVPHGTYNPNLHENSQRIKTTPSMQDQQFLSFENGDYEVVSSFLLHIEKGFLKPYL